MAGFGARVLLGVLLMAATTKADELIDLLDELIKTESTAKRGYSEYSEPVGQYGPASYYEPQASLGYDQPADGYLVPSSYDGLPVEDGYAKAGYGYMLPPPMYGYQQQQTLSYQPQQSYGYGQQPQQPQQPQQQGYGYGQQPQQPQQHGYGYKPKVKKIYIPVVAKKKKKKKMKIISVQRGFYIEGGTQLFGKYKSLYACQKACAATPNCFAGDYNPWFKKCYIHSNYTACGTLRSHKKLIHFKKVPCTIPEAPEGLVMLGVQTVRGVEQKKVKSLSDCLKCCATLGSGIQAISNDLEKQLCFGIDYDFGKHKCYFHVNNNYPPFHLCPANGAPPKVPRDTVPNHSVVSILLCPGPYVP